MPMFFLLLPIKNSFKEIKSLDMVAEGKTLVSEHGFFEVLLDATSGDKSLHSTCNWKPAEIITSFTASDTLKNPTSHSLQISDEEHIIISPAYLQFINHSCSPNVFFNTTIRKLECIAPVNSGDEITFFYPSTEWQMKQPFQCNCGYFNCLRFISGASVLSYEEVARHRFSDFVQNKLSKKFRV